MPTRSSRRPKSKKRKPLSSKSKGSWLLVFAAATALVVATLWIGFLLLRSTAPSVPTFASYQQNSMQLSVFSGDGEQVGEFFVERRTIVTNLHLESPWSTQ